MPASGRLEIDASGYGTLQDPHVEATIVGDRLRSGDLTVGPARVVLAVDDRRGEFRFDIGGAATTYQASGTIRGSVAESGAARVELQKITARAKDMTVRVPVGQVRLSETGQLRINGLRAAVSGRITELGPSVELARAEIQSVRVNGPRDVTNTAAWSNLNINDVRELESTVVVDKVEVVAERFQIPQLKGGKVAAKLAIVDRTRKQLQLDVDDLQTTYLDVPVNATLTAALDPAQLEVKAAVDAGRRGSIDAAILVDPPAQPLVPEAWMKLRPQALESAKIVAKDLRVDGLGAQFNQPALQGTVDGELVAQTRGEIVDVTLKVLDLKVRQADAPIDLRVKLAAAKEQLGVKVDTRLGKRDLIEGNFDFAAGTRALYARGGEALLTSKVEGMVLLPPTELRWLFDQFDVESRPVAGKVKAVVEVHGTLETPTVRAKAMAPGATLAGISFRDLSLEGRLRAGGFAGQVLATQDRGGRLIVDAQGTLAAPAESKVRLRANDFSLEFLNPILDAADAPVRELRGELAANVGVDRATDPDPRGWLRISDLRLRSQTPIRDIRDGDLQARLNKGRLEFAIRGKSSGGTFSIDGGARMPEVMPERVWAELKADDLKIATGTTSLEIDTRTTFRADRTGELWKSNLIIYDTKVELPKSSGRELHPTGDPEDVVYVDARALAEAEKAKAENGESGGMALRMKIRTRDPIKVVGDQFEGRVSVRMDLSQVLGQTAIDGYAEVLDGDVILFDREWEVQRARANFQGRIPPNPDLNVVLAHEFDTATVYIAVRGTKEQPTIDLRSEPGIYDQAQLLSFVLGGSPDEGDRAAGGEEGSLASKAGGVVGGLLASQVEKAVSKAFPIDTLKIGTEGLGGDAVQTVTVGKWLTEDVFVAYQHRFQTDADDNRNEAQLEYHIFQNWVLEGTIGEHDQGRAGSADILWSKRF